MGQLTDRVARLEAQQMPAEHLVIVIQYHRPDGTCDLAECRWLTLPYRVWHEGLPPDYGDNCKAYVDIDSDWV